MVEEQRKSVNSSIKGKGKHHGSEREKEKINWDEWQPASDDSACSSEDENIPDEDQRRIKTFDSHVKTR